MIQYGAMMLADQYTGGAMQAQQRDTILPVRTTCRSVENGERTYRLWFGNKTHLRNVFYIGHLLEEFVGD